MSSRRSWIALLAAGPACAGPSSLPHAGFLDAPVAAVASQVAGRVASVPVREGDRVHKGELLAQLDTREREAAVGQAQASLDQARQALKESQANLDALFPTVQGAGADIAQAQATVDEAETVFQRTRRLVDKGAAPNSDLVTARARMLESRAHLESLTATRAATRGRVRASMAAVSDARAAVDTAQAALEVARVQLEEARVLSPFDGLVVDRDLQPGEWAAPGTPVVTVEDLSQLWVRLDIEETALQGLRLGQPAQVHVIAVPKSQYKGRVIEIGAEGDFAVNRDVKRGRPDVRTFRVRVGLDELAAELRPGMTAEVSFGAPEAPRPASAATP